MFKTDAFRPSYVYAMVFLSDEIHMVPPRSPDHGDRPMSRSSNRQITRIAYHHSHSIVPGGFDVMSYTTRFTPFTSFTIRVEMVFNTS